MDTNTANKALIQAAFNIDLELFEMALAVGAEVHALKKKEPHESDSSPRVEIGNQALHCVIRATEEKGISEDALQIIRRLLDIGVDINVNSQASTPLSLAVHGYSGNGKLIQFLLERGAKPNTPDILRYASTKGVTWLLPLLMQSEVMAELSEEDRKKYYEDALCGAARYGHKEIVELLLEAGVSANARELTAFTQSDSALMVAASKGHQDIVDLLRAQGADIRAQGDRGMTVFLAAAQGGLTELALELLEEGTNFKTSDVQEKNALCYAAEKNNEILARELVNRGLPLITNKLYARSDMNSILESAAKGGAVWLIELCLEAGEKVDVHGSNESTPFMAAASNGHVEAMKVLAAHGANMNRATNGYGETALHYAISGGHTSAVQWLIEHGADLNAEMLDIMHGDLTPLIQAATYNRPKLVEILIHGGADVNHGDSGVGYTPLHYAASEGAIESIEVLLKYGADVNLLSFENTTALEHAASSGQTEAMKHLIKAGASLEVNPEGDNPFHSAASMGYQEAVRLLLDFGIDPKVKDRHGKTALQYAEAKGHFRVIEVLRTASNL